MEKKKQNNTKNRINPDDFLFNATEFKIKQTIEDSNKKVKEYIREKNNSTQREKLLLAK